MNILVTGAKGMIGTALVANLYALKEKKNNTRPNIQIDTIYEYDKDSVPEQLEEFCKEADVVFHLAGVNRPLDSTEFKQGNVDLTTRLLQLLKKYNKNTMVMLASSVQASLTGRYTNSEYGKSKLEGENLVFQHGKDTGAKVAVYRFPNVMGHSRPNYNSAVSTFCYSVANGLDYTVNDRMTEIELVYIDDLVEAMFDLLEGKEQHCEYPEEGYDGVTLLSQEKGRYCFVPVTHKVTLGKIVDLLERFKEYPHTLLMPEIPSGSFEKKLFSLYLTYLPKEKIKFDLHMNCDERGTFTELLKTVSHGQFSVNVSKPGVVKGQHWHNSKWELFIVVSGHGLIQERKLGTDEVIEFEVSGENIQAVHMIPGWTHNIINLSETENLVTLMWANEIFDSEHPDTCQELV